jgi:hypothetical protein
MKRIVILKGSLIDSLEEFVLKKCLEILFPECDIQIRSVARASSPDDEIHIKPDKHNFAL